ncbi:putative Histidine kinase [Magnetospirillum sp. SS-4]|nr:putative Histidine kinase [Magnetospirillum sp. SS-4]
MVLALSLGLSAFAWQESRRAVDHHLNSEFNALIQETRRKLDERITDYTQVLRGVTGLFAAAEGRVSRDDFRRYVTTLELDLHYPALPAVAFARHVRAQDLDGFIDEMRRSGIEDFSVRPPGRRDAYVINAFSEPFVGGNVKALGYDMWQDADRRATMERAAASGQPMITRRITLRIDETVNPVPAFIMYLPVTMNGEILGYVLSPFRMPTLLQDLLGRNDEFLSLAIHDGAEATPDTLFYRSRPEDNATPRLVTRQTLEVGGRRWTLEFSSRPGLEAAAEIGRPWLVLGLGVAFSLLLFGITWSLSRVTDRAEAIADEKTRSLRENQSLLQGIVDNSSAVIFVKGLDGRFLLVNSVYETLFKVTKADIYGKTDFDIFPREVAEIFVENDRKVLDGGAALTIEEEAPHPDGTRTYLTVKFPIPGIDGVPIAICGIATDITEHKTATARMAEINSRLESQAEQLRRSNAELEQFAYVASHDLQEPLRMISSYAQLISRRYGDTLDRDGQDFIAFMVEGASRMQAMILDLLEFSRIGRREDQPTDINAADGVAATLRNLSSAIQKTGAAVEYHDMPHIRVRSHQFLALMQNLIGNAVKYRHPGRPPAIRITARRDGGMWEFAVTDNGIGIQPQYFERIFLIFQRLHTRDKYEGSGIGLAICKKIVEHHGGRIWVESVPDQGSTFRFTLPAAGESDG